MISLSTTKFILFLAIISSTSASLSMESRDVTIVNFLNKTIEAQISHEQQKTYVSIIPESYTLIPKLSSNGKTDLTLSVMLQKKQHKVNLKLTGDQNKIYVLKKAKQIIVKDHDTQQVLATLPKEEI
jgi:hypothetical protein